MITLSGGAGRGYVGYQEAVIFGTWHIAYNDAAELGGKRYGHGSAVVDNINEFWRLSPITKLVLRIGAKAWSWTEVSVRFDILAEFEVYGDPEISDWRD